MLCIFMYITMTYNHDEYAVRASYTFSASALSGAFGMLQTDLILLAEVLD